MSVGSCGEWLVFSCLPVSSFRRWPPSRSSVCSCCWFEMDDLLVDHSAVIALYSAETVTQQFLPVTSQLHHCSVTYIISLRLAMLHLSICCGTKKTSSSLRTTMSRWACFLGEERVLETGLVRVFSSRRGSRGIITVWFGIGGILSVGKIICCVGGVERILWISW